jgi:hypothetical protein
MPDHIRVAVRGSEENERLVQALSELRMSRPARAPGNEVQ